MKYPDLDELLALRGVARALSLRAPGPARALLLGSHRSGYRGRGLEFEEVRPYLPGDDPRSIDWRVTARRGRPYTKLFREERERPVWLLVDLQATMFFGSRLQLKSMLAVRAAALLAWVAALAGDRIGAVIAGPSTVRVLRPRSREVGVLPILASLLDLQPRAPVAMNDSQDFNATLQTLMSLVHPGSLVLVLSDFARLNGASDVLLSGLSAHSECRLFWIVDHLEQQGLPDGRYRGGILGRLWSLDGAGTRGDWQRLWRQRCSHLQALERSLRLTLTRLETTQPAEQTLQRLLGEAKSAA